MTRRPAKCRATKRPAAPVTRLAFEPQHRELFRLAGDDWTAPAEITVRHGVRSWTLTAEFLMTDGWPVTLTTRLARTKGGVSVADQRLAITRTVRGRK